MQRALRRRPRRAVRATAGVRTELVIADNDLIAGTPRKSARDRVSPTSRVAQKRDAVAPRADEGTDALAEFTQVRFDRQDPKDAGVPLAVDERDDGVARAPRQNAGSRVIEVDEAFARSDRLAT